MSGFDDFAGTFKRSPKNNTVIVSELYCNFLKEGGEKSKKRDMKHLYPSGFGDCLRKLVFQCYAKIDDRFDPHKPVDVKFMRIGDAGNAYHHRMQTSFSKMGILRGFWKCRRCGHTMGKDDKWGIFMPKECSCQKAEDDKREGIDLFEYVEIRVKSTSEYKVEGNIDGIIELDKNDPDTRYIIDFKSIKSNKFSVLEKPEEKYIVQMQIYLWLTGIKKAILFYEDKDAHGLKEFVIDYDEEMVAKIKSNAIKVGKIIEKGLLPAREKQYKKDCYACKYCDFNAICYKGVGK